MLRFIHRRGYEKWFQNQIKNRERGSRAKRAKSAGKTGSVSRSYDRSRQRFALAMEHVEETQASN